MRTILSKLFIFLCLIYVCGIGNAEGLVIFAGIPPVAGIVKSIKTEGDLVEILIPPNTDPHTFDISPVVLEKLSRADVFFHTRFPFELKIAKALQEIKSNVHCVDVTRDIKWIEAVNIHHHSHAEREIEDEYIDLHCWLTPENIKIIARNILEELAKINESHQNEYQSNFNQFLKKVEETDREIRSKLEPYKDRKFLVYHPAFGYFAQAYNLKEIYIEVEGRSPSIRELRKIIETTKKEGIKTIYIQPQFDRKPAEAIAGAISGKVEILNDLGEDVLANLLEIADKLTLEFSLKQIDN